MLEKTLTLDYEFELLSGLHIGGGNDTFDIGGADSTVVKNPLTNEPYVPGSSMKGKIRALLTYVYGEIVNTDKEPKLQISDPTILSLFQPLGEEYSHTIQLSRAVFRDAVLTKESAAHLQEYLGTGTFTEIKAENSIDPLKGKAANPRFIERVPAGARFKGQILLQIFEGDNEKELTSFLLEGLRLVEKNYLGGSGTRGYGRISFTEPLQFRDGTKE